MTVNCTQCGATFTLTPIIGDEMAGWNTLGQQMAEHLNKKHLKDLNARGAKRTVEIGEFIKLAHVVLIGFVVMENYTSGDLAYHEKLDQNFAKVVEALEKFRPVKVETKVIS